MQSLLKSSEQRNKPPATTTFAHCHTEALRIGGEKEIFKKCQINWSEQIKKLGSKCAPF